jgi:hypothetical protein
MATSPEEHLCSATMLIVPVMPVRETLPVVQGVEKSMDSNKARAAMTKLLEAREQDAQKCRKRCALAYCDPYHGSRQEALVIPCSVLGLQKMQRHSKRCLPFRYLLALCGQRCQVVECTSSWIIRYQAVLGQLPGCSLILSFVMIAYRLHVPFKQLGTVFRSSCLDWCVLAHADL